jgi:hypothetical protein
LYEFLGRWGLNALTDWDLPNPQGPLNGPKEMTSFLLPSDKSGRILYMPGWYGLIASRDDVASALTNTVGPDGDDRFISGDGWPVRNSGPYAGMFLCRYVLHALRQRGELPEGSRAYSTAIKALAAWLYKRLPQGRGSQMTNEDNPNPDRTARVRKLLRMAKARLGGKQPADLRVKA